MTFFTLLTNEMRLRLRRERTIWVIVIYLLLMGSLGWISLNSSSNNPNAGVYNNAGSNTLSDIGLNLYALLSYLQLLLIIFITPSFTASSINSEKERQTYDMLICSCITPLSLIAGKLLAGMMNALLLIAASIPLFSLVFFFGGVGPAQVFSALTLFVGTACLMGALGLFCSTLFRRPAVSTAIAYMVGMLWLILPLLISSTLISSGGWHYIQNDPGGARLLFVWNPLAALANTYPNGSGGLFPINISLLGFGYGSYTGGVIPSAYSLFGTWNISAWIVYSLITLIAAFLLFVASIFIVRPRAYNYRNLFNRHKKNTPSNKFKAIA